MERARSPRAGQGNRPSRSGDRARVFLTGCWKRSRRSRGGVAGRARPTHGSGADPRARRAAGSDLHVFKHALVQDTALRLTAAESSPAHPRRHRTGAGGAVARIKVVCAQGGHRAVITPKPALTSKQRVDRLKAAKPALSRSAYAEADRYVAAGLALIPRLPHGGLTGNRLNSRFLVARLAAALSPLKAYTAPETVAHAFRAAKRLLDAGVGDDLQRFFVLSGLYLTPYIAARLESALGGWRASSWKPPQNGRTNRIIVSRVIRMLAMMQIAMGTKPRGIGKSATGRRVP